MAATDPYLDVAAFKTLTIAPTTYVDAVESAQAGWTLAQLTYWSRWIDSRLRKRYAVPFDPTDPPVTVQGWLAQIVTVEVYLKRGVDPTDAQFSECVRRADVARAEIKEAADNTAGLFELPLKASDPATIGVSRGGPLGYNEQSPYTWPKVQADAMRDEAADRSGS